MVDVNILYQALSSMVDFQMQQEDAIENERRKVFSWFDKLSTKKKNRYIQNIPLSDLTMNIIQFYRMQLLSNSDNDCNSKPMAETLMTVTYHALSYDVGGSNPTNTGCGGYILLSNNLVWWTAANDTSKRSRHLAIGGPKVSGHHTGHAHVRRAVRLN